MRRIAIALGLVLAVAAPACSGRTAILVEVAAEDEGLVLDRLSFVVSPEVVVPDHDPRFVRDVRSSIDADVSGRNLAVDPYRLLLSDGRGAGDAPLLVAVLGYRGGVDQPVAFGALPPRRFVSGDVLLHRVVLVAREDVVPGATGCVSWEDGESGDPADRDCDGARPPEDCDDMDPARSPLLGEVCGNGIDDDCDGTTDEREDRDADGVDQCSDCDDTDPLVRPGAAEICDGDDNDCDGQCDEGIDGDGDGRTVCGTTPAAGASCGPFRAPDCRDDDPSIRPGRSDRCDGRDEDCSGACDSAPEYDGDGDGYTTCGTLASLPTVAGVSCGAVTPLLADCDDGDDDRHPFEHERCNGKDDNCDGQGPAPLPCFADDGSGCALGHAGCDDDDRDGDSGLGPCVPDEAPRVAAEPQLCAAHASCAGDDDRFRCAMAQALTWDVTCELAVRSLARDPGRAATFEVCPGADAALPAVPETAGCLWQVVGDLAQEQLRVGLAVARFAPVTARLASCGGRFVVTGLASPLAFEPDTVALLYSDLGRPQARLARVRVTPRLVDVGGTCPAAPLTCNIDTP